MSGARTTVLLVSALFVCGGCGRCGPPPAADVSLDLDREPDADDVAAEDAPVRLAKHDWNGLTVMMRETQAREALRAIGFDLAPSRQETFPVLDEEGLGLRLVPVEGFTPPLVTFETEKHASPLDTVYGLRLWFHRNRLYAFQPVYHSSPLDLVEPEDEHLPPAEMEERLVGTFGECPLSGEGTVVLVGEDERRKERMMIWRDEDLVVLYRRPLSETLPSYDLMFFSPRGNERVARLVDRLLD
jgi:hypothetical protein